MVPCQWVGAVALFMKLVSASQEPGPSARLGGWTLDGRLASLGRKGLGICKREGKKKKERLQVEDDLD